MRRSDELSTLNPSKYASIGASRNRHAAQTPDAPGRFRRSHADAVWLEAVEAGKPGYGRALLPDNLERHARGSRMLHRGNEDWSNVGPGNSIAR